MASAGSRPRSQRLAGRVCLVTGGAGGIGWAITHALARSGAHVHACDLSPAHLERARTELETARLSSDVTLTQLDVTDHDALRHWISNAYTTHGRIDVLIHNAAFIRWTDVEQMTPQEAELTMRTGYDALVHAVNAVLPLMRATGGGHIVALGSAAGRIFVKGPSAAYAATKAAIEGYTEMLGLELAGTTIGVTLVRPGAVSGTDFFRHHVPPSRMPRLADFLPSTTPEQVAQAIADTLGTRRRHLDIPRYLPAMYRLYAMAPGLMQNLTAKGGNGRRTYAGPGTATPAQDTRAPRLLHRLGPRLIGPRLFASRPVRVPMTRLDTLLQHHSHGRISLGRYLGFGSLLLTTTGHKTGLPRVTPLFYFPHQQGYAIVATNFGQAHHPAWSANLLTHPQATITIDADTFPVTARLLHGEERTEAWKAFTHAAPGYQTYADRSNRHIRIFALDNPTPSP